MKTQLTATEAKREIEDRMTPASLAYWDGCDSDTTNEIITIAQRDGADEAIDQLAALAFDFEPTDQAEPSNYADNDGSTQVEWIEPAKLPSGRECYVYYRFSEEEEAEAGEEASNLPFDHEHIDRIKLSGE